MIELNEPSSELLEILASGLDTVRPLEHLDSQLAVFLRLIAIYILDRGAAEDRLRDDLRNIDSSIRELTAAIREVGKCKSI